MTELEIKAAVRARDGLCCAECGMSNEEHLRVWGKSLEVHRLIPGSKYSLQGCVTLCLTCHGPKPRLPHRTPPAPGVPVRLVILTSEEVRAALRLEAAKRGEDMSDVATSILEEALADSLAEVRARQPRKGKKKGGGE